MLDVYGSYKHIIFGVQKADIGEKICIRYGDAAKEAGLTQQMVSRIHPSK